MANFHKNPKEFTEDELHEGIQNMDPRYGALLSYELQRRLAEENSISSKRFAKWSLIVSVVAIVISVVLASIQILISSPYDEKCDISQNQEKKVIDCQSTLKLNFFGNHTWATHRVETTLSTSTMFSIPPFDTLLISSSTKW